MVILASLFFLQTLSAEAQHVTATPDHASGIYALNETVGWTLEASPESSAAPYSYVVRENNDRRVQSGQLDLHARKTRIEVKLQEPGMLIVDIDANEKGSEPLQTNTTAATSVSVKRPLHALQLGAAVAPTLLQPSVPKPADFDVFWQDKLAELAKVPIHPILTPVADSHKGTDLYKVKLDSLGSHVQGYLAKPATPGRFPALIIYQWAGVYKLNPDDVAKRAQEGWLAFDVDSHDIAPDQDTGIPTDYYRLGDHDRETSYFLKMYLRDTRAVDYVATLPEWDGRTIVLMGTSMGGQQSLVTAALNPNRITTIVVNEPAGADTNGNLHGRKAGYPYWNSEEPIVMNTALYFDPVNFAPQIKAATLIGVGFLDTSAPPVGLWTVYNELSGPKEIVPMIESAHNNVTPDKQEHFLARQREVLAALVHEQPVTLMGISSTATPHRPGDAPVAPGSVAKKSPAVRSQKP